MRRFARSCLFAILAVFCVFTLTACHHKGLQPSSPKPYTGTSGEHYTMLTHLHKQGVGVIETGSTLTLVLPTDCFFNPLTTQVKAHRKGTMALIAKLLKTYQGAPITVSGHVDKVYSHRQQQKDSFYYPQAIAAYLWNHGIPMQNVRVKPDGSTVNVSTTNNPRGAADNRRVEIYVGLKPA